MDRLNQVEVITFGEFVEKWFREGSKLIGPKDYETRDKNQLGIVHNGYFKTLKLSDRAREIMNIATP